MNTPQGSLSSSSTLWATASKEWVIPAKPRPGRKAKKEVAATISDGPNQEAEKGRRIQNRVAQRAFRERKQTQIAELQARVQSYEKGEVERNITLQNIAKRLKEENEKLLRENLLLKEKLSNLEKPEIGRKRHRPNSPSPSSAASHSQADYSARKKSKCICESPHSSDPPFSNSFVPSPSSMVSPNEVLESRISPFPFDSQQETPILLNQNSPMANLLEFPSDSKPNNFESGVTFPNFDCGFCNEDTPCVCQDIGLREGSTEITSVSRQVPHKMEDFEQQKNTVRSIGQTFIQTPTSTPCVSILDNLPAYQPPIPLPWSALAKPKPIFSVSAPPQMQQPSASSTNCSGDPANCMACANDSFGKAFCQAVQESTDAISPCADCPCLTDEAYATGPAFVSTSGEDAGPWRTVTVPLEAASNTDSETIPTSEAWRQLKSHPNVEFTDLALLADVVVRRSRCAGPRQQTVPPIGVPPVSISEGVNPDRDHSQTTDAITHLGHREHEHDHAEESSSPRDFLVPHQVLMECGRQRLGVREVNADALKAALRLLDAKFGRT